MAVVGCLVRRVLMMPVLPRRGLVSLHWKLVSAAAGNQSCVVRRTLVGLRPRSSQTPDRDSESAMLEGAGAGVGGGRRRRGEGLLLRGSRWKWKRYWTALSVLVANVLGYLLYLQFEDSFVEEEDEEEEETALTAVPVGFWQKCMMALPWRHLSRGWGYFHSVELPLFLRPVLIGGYAKITGCDLDEAADSDYSHYRNIGDFFKRALKPGCRPVDETAALVSPADGRVVACGKVCKDRVENVKGIRYSMAKFLGPQTWALSGDEPKAAVQEVGGQGMRDYGNKLLQREQEDELFECVIYLAPGDYHRFHSPAQWTIHHRRHFPGDLLSVHPKVASWFPNLFVVNERAAYYGKWQHGFFAVGVVGATNVGSIKIPFDLALETNQQKFKRNSWLDLRFESPVEQSKGSYFGEFNMGSTLVLIFEAPRGSRFTVCTGDRVRVGQRLFQVPGET